MRCIHHGDMFCGEVAVLDTGRCSDCPELQPALYGIPPKRRVGEPLKDYLKRRDLVIEAENLLRQVERELERLEKLS